MGEQQPPDENHETNDQANDDRDRDAGIPGDDHGCPPGDTGEGGYLPGDAGEGCCPPGDVGDVHGYPSEGFDDCGYVPEWELEGPAASISLGDAADIDPALLAAITGPDGLGGNALCRAYEQDQAADVLRPGPVLAALTEQAAGDVGRLTDEQLMGALSAARRLENRAAYLQAVTIAEFARRRAAQAEAASAANPRRGTRSGDLPDQELAMELLTSQVNAGARIEAAACLTSRLPADPGQAWPPAASTTPARPSSCSTPAAWAPPTRPGPMRSSGRPPPGCAGPRPQGRRPGDETRPEGREGPQDPALWSRLRLRIAGEVAARR